MKEIQYCVFTRHAEDVNFIKNKKGRTSKKNIFKNQNNNEN